MKFLVVLISCIFSIVSAVVMKPFTVETETSPFDGTSFRVAYAAVSSTSDNDSLTITDMTSPEDKGCGFWTIRVDCCDYHSSTGTLHIKVFYEDSTSKVVNCPCGYFRYKDSYFHYISSYASVDDSVNILENAVKMVVSIAWEEGPFQTGPFVFGRKDVTELNKVAEYKF